MKGVSILNIYHDNEPKFISSLTTLIGPPLLVIIALFSSLFSVTPIYNDIFLN